VTAERDAQTAAAQEARHTLAQERGRVDAFRATRRYRLAARLAMPLDRLRGRRDRRRVG
jgi:hypothetical protein